MAEPERREPQTDDEVEEPQGSPFVAWIVLTASFWLAVVVTLAPLVPFRSQTSAALGLKCSPVLRI